MQILSDLIALLHADRALDAAHDALAEAKRRAGGAFVHNHPLVDAVREAKGARARILGRLPEKV